MVVPAVVVAAKTAAFFDSFTPRRFMVESFRKRQISAAAPVRVNMKTYNPTYTPKNSPRVLGTIAKPDTTSVHVVGGSKQIPGRE